MADKKEGEDGDKAVIKLLLLLLLDVRGDKWGGVERGKEWRR